METTTTTTTSTTSTSSSASGSRRKRRYINISGDDIARAKAEVAQLKSRRDQSRYAVQNPNYVITYSTTFT